MNILTRPSAIDVGYVDYTSAVSTWYTVHSDGRVTYKLWQYGESTDIEIPRHAVESYSHLSTLVAYVFDNGLLPKRF